MTLRRSVRKLIQGSRQEMSISNEGTATDSGEVIMKLGAKRMAVDAVKVVTETTDSVDVPIPQISRPQE